MFHGYPLWRFVRDQSRPKVRTPPSLYCASRKYRPKSGNPYEDVGKSRTESVCWNKSALSRRYPDISAVVVQGQYVRPRISRRANAVGTGKRYCQVIQPIGVITLSWSAETKDYPRVFLPPDRQVDRQSGSPLVSDLIKPEMCGFP